jgi:hypothetical protein
MICPLCNERAAADPKAVYPVIARRLEAQDFHVYLVHKECLDRIAHPDALKRELE